MKQCQKHTLLPYLAQRSQTSSGQHSARFPRTQWPLDLRLPVERGWSICGSGPLVLFYGGFAKSNSFVQSSSWAFSEAFRLAPQKKKKQKAQRHNHCTMHRYQGSNKGSNGPGPWVLRISRARRTAYLALGVTSECRHRQSFSTISLSFTDSKSFAFIFSIPMVPSLGLATPKVSCKAPQPVSETPLVHGFWDLHFRDPNVNSFVVDPTCCRPCLDIAALLGASFPCPQ